MDLKPNDGAQAIGAKTGIDKIIIGKSVLNEKPVAEFVERMRARGYDIDTDGISAIITGENLEAYYDEIQSFAMVMTPFLEAQINELQERTENQLNNI